MLPMVRWACWPAPGAGVMRSGFAAGRNRSSMRCEPKDEDMSDDISHGRPDEPEHPPEDAEDVWSPPWFSRESTLALLAFGGLLGILVVMPGFSLEAVFVILVFLAVGAFVFGVAWLIQSGGGEEPASESSKTEEHEAESTTAGDEEDDLPDWWEDVE